MYLSNQPDIKYTAKVSIELNYGQPPAFTLKEWIQIFNGLESLEEFGNMEGLFRKDCLTGAFEMNDWLDVKQIARDNLARLRREEEERNEKQLNQMEPVNVDLSIEHLQNVQDLMSKHGIPESEAYLFLTREMWESDVLRNQGYSFTKEQLDIAEKSQSLLIDIRNGVRCYLQILMK